MGHAEDAVPSAVGRASELAGALQRTRLRVGQRLRRRPFLYRLVSGMGETGRDRLPTSATELVLDGFPRSGNTFSLCAFRTANPDVEAVTSHLHAPGQIIWAVRRGIPVMLLIRDPDEVALSEGVRGRGFTLGEIFRWYADFYSGLLPYHDGVTVATFEQVTTDFGAVIEALNRRFGTSFAPYRNSPENDAAVFEILGRYAERTFDGPPEAREERVARPSPRRDELKEQIEHRLDDPEVRPARRAARRAYDRWHRHAAVAVD